MREKQRGRDGGNACYCSVGAFWEGADGVFYTRKSTGPPSVRTTRSEGCDVLAPDWVGRGNFPATLGWLKHRFQIQLRCEPRSLPDPPTGSFDCVVVVSQLIAALQSEQARLSNLLTETTSNLETQLSNERGVSKAREDDLEVASEQLEMVQVRMVVVEG